MPVAFPRWSLSEPAGTTLLAGYFLKAEESSHGSRVKYDLNEGASTSESIATL